MSRCEQYLKSFGQLTKEQEKMAKNTLCYQGCLFSDAFEDFVKLLIESFLNLFKTRRIKNEM